MSLTLQANVGAIGIGNSTSFGASGGTPPYTFAITTSGAGGSINPYTGIYTAPYSIVSTPQTSIDIVTATDALSATASTSITVCGVLELICDIIQQGMGLANGRVYTWDQKINQPTDSGLYVAVSMLNCKPFGNNIDYATVPLGPSNNLFSYRTYSYPSNPGTTGFNSYTSYNTSWNWLSYQQTVNGILSSVQTVNMQAQIQLDIISRSSEARDKKELVVMALQSVYSEQQQEANSFYISKLTTSFTNLSTIDGAAIPYRYALQFSAQYFIKNVQPIPYFNQFQTPSVVVNS